MIEATIGDSKNVDNALHDTQQETGNIQIRYCGLSRLLRAHLLIAGELGAL